MKEAQWSTDGYAPSYLALVWSRFKSISPWYMLLVCAPVLMWLLAASVLHRRPSLILLAPIGALMPLATAHKAGLGRLRLRADLKELIRSDPDAVPCDIEITTGKNLLGEDEGVLTLDTGSLIFRGNRTEFRLGRNDVGEIGRIKKPGGYDENELTMEFGEDRSIKIRQRSFGMVESTSGRFKRVMASWEADSRTDENAVLPPSMPNIEAHFATNSAYSWSAASFGLALVSCVSAAHVTLTADKFTARLGIYAFDVLALTISAAFIWAGVYCLRLAGQRREFYAQYELPPQPLVN